LDLPGRTLTNTIMKGAIMLALLGCALGLPQVPIEKSSSVAPSSKPEVTSSAAPKSLTSSTSLSKRQGHFGGGFGGFFGFPQFRSNGVPHHERNWGPKAYGMGLNNPWAFPVNPFEMERALMLTDRCPGTLVNVGVDGEPMITDENGFEVEILDWFGNDVTDGIDEFEPSFYMGGFGGFGGASNFGIPPPGFGGSPSMGGPPGTSTRSGSTAQAPCFKRRKLDFDGFFGQRFF